MTQQAPQPSELFELFWRAYPRRVGKGEARKVWAKLHPSVDLVQQMLVTLSWQRDTEQWTRDGGQYIPHPSTWLRQERWEDEPVETPLAPMKPEHWRDECSRLHGGACHNVTWHNVMKERSA